MLDWLRLWPEFIRLNLQKSRHQRRLRRARQTIGTLPLASAGPAPCQSGSDSGRAGATRCEACHRLDHAARYRFVCPHFSMRGRDAVCQADSTAIRPRWGRAALALLAPPLAAFVLGAAAFWGLLRHQGLDRLSLLDVLLPHRWENIDAARRTHFRRLALRALADQDPAAASIALFSAAGGDLSAVSAEDRGLARLATLGGYHSVADEIHSAILAAARPGEAETHAIAWHDDLLLADRPARLAELALARLHAPDAHRDFWLRAFFESIRHPGVAAPLLAEPTLQLPHPGLRHALAARAAIDADEKLAAADQLIALAGLPPGPPVRAFLTHSWLDLDQANRARSAALDPSHPAQDGEAALLLAQIALRLGEPLAAQNLLLPLLDQPGPRPALLAAMIVSPEPETIAALTEKLGASTAPSKRDPRHLAALWLAARRAKRPDLAQTLALALAELGHAVPDTLRAADLQGEDRAARSLAITLLPLDRESVYALRTR